MVLWSCLGTIHVACARAKHRRMRRRFAHHDGSQRRPGGRERANDASLVLRDDVASTPYPLMGSDRVPSEVARFIIEFFADQPGTLTQNSPLARDFNKILD